MQGVRFVAYKDVNRHGTGIQGMHKYPLWSLFLSELIHWKYEIKFSKYLASLSWPFALSAELSQSHIGNTMDNLICLVFTKLSRFPFWFAFC